MKRLLIFNPYARNKLVPMLPCMDLEAEEGHCEESEQTMGENSPDQNFHIYAVSLVSSMRLPHHTPQNTTELLNNTITHFKVLCVGCIYAPDKVNPNIFQFYSNFLSIFHHTSMHPFLHKFYVFLSDLLLFYFTFYNLLKATST